MTDRELMQMALDALEALMRRDTGNTCQHENTHRGGAIWEICDDCAAKWADDRGGKPKWEDPPEWVAAEDAINSIRAALAAPQPAQEPECERCGEAPRMHTSTYWCDNQSFTTPDGRTKLGCTTPQAPHPKLTVRLTSFPESNGKRNWTAMFVRTEKWNGLIGNCGGITIDRGECWNRVAYEAERARFLIGERDTEPHILDYGDDISTPVEWAGELRGSGITKGPAA